MNRLGIAFVLSIGVAGVLFACSSSSGTGGTGSSPSSPAGSSSSSAPADSCEIPPATYTIHFTKAADAGASCADIPDQNVDVQVSDASSSDDAGSGCTQTEDKSTCTFSVTCTKTEAGATTKSVSTIKNASGSVGGQDHITVTDGSGQVTYDCTYDFVYEKSGG